MRAPFRSAVLALALLALAACGDDGESSTTDPGTDPAAGACPVGTPDCVDADLGGEG